MLNKNYMRFLRQLFLVVLLSPFFLSLGGASCGDPGYRPVYIPTSEFRSLVQQQAADRVENPLGFIVKDNDLVIIDKNRGFHLIDNTDPSEPTFDAFVQIPLMKYLSIKGDYLYAVSGIDLVTLDISDRNNMIEVARIENLFPNDPFKSERLFWYEAINDDLGVVVDREIVPGINVDCYDIGGCYGPASIEAAAPNSGSGEAIEGSTSQLLIEGDYLYVISDKNLITISLLNQALPEVVDNQEIKLLCVELRDAEIIERCGEEFHLFNNRIFLPGIVETLYIDEGTLYIGSTTGVFLADLTTPSSPTFEGFFQHEWACDPVVATEDTAYVTVRSGFSGLCGGINRLDILDVTDISAPVEIASYPMDNPHGLAIDDTSLFLADGASGLKVFDVSDAENIQSINNLGGRFIFDVIVQGDLAISIGETGLDQYDIMDINNINIINSIEF